MDRYLVELVRPDAGWQDVQALAARARAVAADLDVRFLRAIYLPEDATCALLFEGRSASAVREAGRRAGGAVERVSVTEVIAE